MSRHLDLKLIKSEMLDKASSIEVHTHVCEYWICKVTFTHIIYKHECIHTFDSESGLHACTDVVSQVTVKQPSPRVSGHHLHSLESPREEVKDICTVHMICLTHTHTRREKRRGNKHRVKSWETSCVDMESGLMSRTTTPKIRIWLFNIIQNGSVLHCVNMEWESWAPLSDKTWFICI